MKIAIIGSSRGIGKFIADNLVEHEVLRISRTLTGDNCYKADVTDWKDMSLCANSIKNKFDHIDCLIYCAGVLGKIGPAMNIEPDSWANTINVNLNGFFNTMRSFYDLLEKAENPKVIAFSGGGATKGRPNFSVYATSKCGLVRLVETLAEELPRFRINAIAPGSILTDMTHKVIAAGPEFVGKKEYDDAVKTDRLPYETLELVKFLLSPEGSGVSGRLIAARWDDWKNPECYSGEAGFLKRIEPKV